MNKNFHLVSLFDTWPLEGHLKLHQQSTFVDFKHDHNLLSWSYGADQKKIQMSHFVHVPQAERQSHKFSTGITAHKTMSKDCVAWIKTNQRTFVIQYKCTYTIFTKTQIIFIHLQWWGPGVQYTVCQLIWNEGGLQLNLLTGLKCQWRSGQIHSSLFTEECRPLRICIIFLVCPGRFSAFPSDAHPLPLHLLNCNRIFKFKNDVTHQGVQKQLLTVGISSRTNGETPCWDKSI